MNLNIGKNINSKVWDKLFSSKSWGKYPSIQLVKFIASKYYNMKDRSSINILEIGCGPGGNLWYLAREGFKVSGIDFGEIDWPKFKSSIYLNTFAKHYTDLENKPIWVSNKNKKRED
jgi:SAM-dependent methyltransferase